MTFQTTSEILWSILQAICTKQSAIAPIYQAIAQGKGGYFKTQKTRLL